MKICFCEAYETDVESFLKEAPRVSRRSRSRYYCWTQSGYLNGDLFRRVFALVAQEWAARNPGLSIILFGDQCSCHLDPKMISGALEGTLYLFSIPFNST